MKSDARRWISAISRLLQMQRDDGGFALWDKEGPEEYWLSAYAMDFLVRAGEQGLQRTNGTPSITATSACCVIYRSRG
ncbi:alpha-2-macroglobulin domain-containing protein [Klebsiella michiganensis]|uniref:Alpha-2-macroglobulin domain-containing protein n=1 Tax=Klebsiella michiganensis TaxID=1134687 RepID=A0A7H4PND8_9ENTR|nr:alpha-2-macroglobulin domain-containing protein [Klebsiella michiganensis]